MPDVAIGRLKLTLAGLSAEDGERVAQRVAERLAAGLPDMKHEERDVDSLEVALTAQHGETMERMAARIAEAIRAGLER